MREEIRFSRHPVSISTFTSRPKHCEEEEEEEAVLEGRKAEPFLNDLETSKENHLAGNVDQILLLIFIFFI